MFLYPSYLWLSVSQPTAAIESVVCFHVILLFVSHNVLLFGVTAGSDIAESGGATPCLKRKEGISFPRRRYT